MRRVICGRGGCFACIAFLVLGLAAPSADAIILDFSSLAGSRVDFTGLGGAGASFEFFDEAANSFNDIFITTSDGVGDSVGLTGDIDGTFTYVNPGPGVFQLASPVGGVGTLSIWDGTGVPGFGPSNTLTASFVWINISTLSGAGGGGGDTNFAGVVNLSGFSYTGGNSDLSALVGIGSIQTSFQSAVAGLDLDTMSTTGGSYGSYSGSIEAPIPEPATIGLLGLGLVGMAIRRKRISI